MAIKFLSSQNIQGDLDVSGNITVSGTVDGVDISDFKSSYDNHNHDDRYYTETESDARFAPFSHQHSYLPLAGGTLTGGLTIDTSSGNNALVLKGTSPTISLLDNDGGDDFYIHVNSNNFYVLANRDANDTPGAGWESPHPLQIEADTNRGYLFGMRMFATDYHPYADTWTTARTLSLTGDASGSVIWDGSADASLSVTVNNDSHVHSFIQAGGGGPSTEDLNSVADSVSVGQLSYRGYNSSSTNKPPASDNANGVITVGQHSGNYNAQLAFSSNGNMYWRDNPGASYGPWRTLWDSGNDGSGSGLDADLLDGLHASAFALSSHSHDYVSEGGTDFSGTYPLTVRTGADTIYSNSGMTFTGSSDQLYVAGSVKAPIFYDSNDTNFYLDPSGTTQLAHCNVNGAIGSRAFTVGSHGWRIEQSTTTTNPVTFRFDNTKFRFYAGGGSGEVLTIQENGNVGIGTTSPVAKLQVEKSSEGSIPALGANTSFLKISNSGGNYGSMIGQLGSGNAYFQVQRFDGSATAYNLLLQPNGGNVGIGTTSPAAKLQVNGKITLGDAFVPTSTEQENILNLIVGSSSSGQQNGIAFYENDGGFAMKLGYDGTGSGDANALRIYNNSDSAIFTFQNGGNVGIGTTAPSQKLYVSGNIFASGNLYAGSTSVFLDSEFGYMKLQAPNGAFVQSGSTFKPIQASAFTIGSDYRLKSNIAPLENAIDRVNQLNVHRFNWSDRLDEAKVDGFIAHEVAEVIPEAVFGEKDAVREDGTPDHQSIDQSKIVPLLTAALQEALEKINQLETRIQTLENNG